METQTSFSQEQNPGAPVSQEEDLLLSVPIQQDSIPLKQQEKNTVCLVSQEQCSMPMIPKEHDMTLLVPEQKDIVTSRTPDEVQYEQEIHQSSCFLGDKHTISSETEINNLLTMESSLHILSTRPSVQKEQDMRFSVQKEMVIRPSVQKEQNKRPSGQTEQDVEPPGQMKKYAQPAGQAEQDTWLSSQAEQDTCPLGHRQQNVQSSDQGKQNAWSPGQIQQDGELSGQIEQDGELPGQMENDGELPGQVQQYTQPSCQAEEYARPSGQSEQSIGPPGPVEQDVQPAYQAEQDAHPPGHAAHDLQSSDQGTQNACPPGNIEQNGELPGQMEQDEELSGQKEQYAQASCQAKEDAWPPGQAEHDVRSPGQAEHDTRSPGQEEHDAQSPGQVSLDAQPPELRKRRPNHEMEQNTIGSKSYVEKPREKSTSPLQSVAEVPNIGEYYHAVVEGTLRSPNNDHQSSLIHRVALLVIGVLLFGYIWYMLTTSTYVSEPKISIMQIFKKEFESLKTNFPDQREDLWLRSEKMLLKHLNKTHPLEPATIILTAAQDGERTLHCLSEHLARTYAHSLNATYLVINGPSKVTLDSTTTKLQIDEELTSGFESTARAGVLHRLETLPPGALLILYKYCDHANAAFKNVALVLTVLLEEPSLETNLSLTELEEKVKDFLWEWFTGPDRLRSYQEMDGDKLSGVWSRISHLVLPALPVEAIEAGRCP